LKAPSGLLRAGWNLVDQVISSATNALLSILIARSVSDSAFGGFGVAFTIFSVFIGLTRAIAASPLSVRFAGAEEEEFKQASAAGAGTALAIGLVGGLGCVVAGLFLDGAVSTSLIALGVVLPGLLVQDAWRLVFFAEARPRAAAANDAAWAVLQLSAILALTALDVDAIGPLVLAWGLSACAAALLGVRQSRTLPRPGRARSWLRTHYDLTKYLVLEYVTLQGGHQIAMLVIATVGTLSAVGALRGAQTLLGPTTILAVGMYTFALPEFSRRRQQLSRAGWLKGAVGLSAVVTGLGVLWGALFLLAPDAVGKELLGDSWTGTDSILVASIIQQAGAAIAIGPSTMLYAMDRAKVTLKIHTALSPLMLLGGVGGVLLGDAEGAAWGFALAFWSVVPAWWIRVVREAGTMGAAATQESVLD
jgi:O-antigen/teichoic acid export membrane protein